MESSSKSNIIDTTGNDRLPENQEDRSYDTFDLRNAIKATNLTISSASDVKKIKNEKIEKEFEQLKSITDYNSTHANSLYSDADSSLNRYSDILPYDSNMVSLSGSKYINASFINSPCLNSFIATQGPKDNTIGDFWQMVYENKTSLIIMLCNLVEKKTPKCSKYWAADKLKNFGLVVDNESELDSNLIERNFTLTNKKYSEVRTIKQLHFTGWPDHGVPEIDDVYDSFTSMLNIVDDTYKSNSAPIVIHCSAGVGRTGTFMAIYNIHYIIQKQLSINNENKNFQFNIWNTVRKLKEQRLLSVENVLQYKFIYSFFNKYFSKLLV